ncbi:cytochrome P450 [Iodidimonas sp. SYSU 1G8]|uniref:cytochrome P450 n=1 Tax=Iodidimonas sp. SYSU 1G8 TaxID=3133967 RepID=UPI0031FE6945
MSDVEVNRMAEPVQPASPDEVNLLDVEVQECPYPAYKMLRDEAPIWKDPVTGFYTVTRYEDLRKVLMDTESFSNSRSVEDTRINTDRAKRMRALYEEKGWLPAPTLAARDDPDHRALRNLFDKTFRAGKIKELDPDVQELAYRLIDDFIEDGRCDWVRQFAVPLPLIIIGRQMGAKEEDIWQIKAWTDAWVKKLGMMQTEDEERWSVEMEIEQQHYFQPIIEKLRQEPNDSLLSDLVNTFIPEWGRTLNDNELHGELTGDTFVGGSETSTNALSAGIMLLADDRDSWLKLKNDPDKYLKTFCEEVLRLEGPVQGLFRIAARDIEMHGVTIPKGAIINTRYAAANRDERHFECPDKLDLERKNAGSHLAFGSGIHHCLGAPLARRELYWGFKSFIDRIDDFWLAPGKNKFRHQPNFCLRALKELHIEFTPKKH